MLKLELALYTGSSLFNKAEVNSKFTEVFSLMNGLWSQAER